MEIRSHNELVSKVIENGVLHSPWIVKAFYSIDRVDFVPEDQKPFAYRDHPLPIGYSQTISQPSTVAFMMELLSPQKGEKVLDVGSGSGWTTALLSEMVGEEGCVVGIEIIPQLVEFGRNNLKKYDKSNAKIIQASGELGYQTGAPYDKILVSASADSVPDTLVDQLKVSGIMVIPVRDSIYRITKVNEKTYKEETYRGFIFVPLIE